MRFPFLLDNVSRTSLLLLQCALEFLVVFVCFFQLEMHMTWSLSTYKALLRSRFLFSTP